ncbi:MAG: hypothetical protein ATN36_00285 [Epulopiscium sp. Nele67-Bin005]|nr:MAG: hypothetical protein ATN36_00285 [Epulopiscium sp. Nele67-Bin005]
MTRGTLNIILGNEIYSSVEFNGNMNPNSDMYGGVGINYLLKYTKDKKSFHNAIKKFLQDTFGVGAEDVTNFDGVEEDTLENSEDLKNFCDSITSDYTYILNKTKKIFKFQDNEGTSVIFPPNTVLVWEFEGYYGIFDQPI